MRKEEKMKRVQEQLKCHGYRLTNQRKLVLEIILDNEYSNCKEIYYEVKKRDGSVGIATVYRTVQVLEDIKVVNKKMMVHVQGSLSGKRGQ